LQPNGGPTQTIALGAGSSAIDFTTCLQTTDQRGDGFPRPDPLDTGATTKCDAGAYESQDPTTSDLSLIKAVNNPTPNVGDAISFTVPLTNDGPDTTTNVTIGDQLPGGFSFVLATPSRAPTARRPASGRSVPSLLPHPRLCRSRRV